MASVLTWAAVILLLRLSETLTGTCRETQKGVHYRPLKMGGVTKSPSKDNQLNK